MRLRHFITGLILLYPWQLLHRMDILTRDFPIQWRFRSAGMQDYIDAGSFRGMNYEGYP